MAGPDRGGRAAESPCAPRPSGVRCSPEALGTAEAPRTSRAPCPARVSWPDEVIGPDPLTGVVGAEPAASAGRRDGRGGTGAPRSGWCPGFGGASGKRAEAGGGGGLTGSATSGTARPGRGCEVRGVKTEGSSSGSKGSPVSGAEAGRAGVERAGGCCAPGGSGPVPAGCPGGLDGRRGTGACRASVLMHSPFPRARAVCRTRAVVLLGRARYGSSRRARIPVRPDRHPGSDGCAGRVAPYVRVTLRVGGGRDGTGARARGICPEHPSTLR